MEQRCKRSAVLEIQRADTNGPAHLVARDGKGVNAKPLNIDGDMEPTLHGVGMKEGAACMSRARKVLDGLHDAGLVVGKHDGDKRDVPSQQGLEGFRGNEPLAARFNHVDRETSGAKLPEVIEDGIVLDSGNNHAAPLGIAGTSRLGQTHESHIVRLGTAAGEDHLARAHTRSKRFGDVPASRLEGGLRLASKAVQRIGVCTGDIGGVVGELSGNRLGAQRRRSGVIKVYDAVDGCVFH